MMICSGLRLRHDGARVDFVGEIVTNPDRGETRDTIERKTERQSRLDAYRARAEQGLPICPHDGEY